MKHNALEFGVSYHSFKYVLPIWSALYPPQVTDLQSFLDKKYESRPRYGNYYLPKISIFGEFMLPPLMAGAGVLMEGQAALDEVGRR